MKISNEQVKHILARTREEIKEQRKADEAVIRLTDQELIRKVTKDVIHMDDREEMIAELKARIDAGEYHVDGKDIADAMIRRAIADSMDE